jgi:hypothetical protein
MKTKKELKPVLRDFLIENNAYNSFMKNINENYKAIISTINYENGFICLSEAFNWCNTREGIKYWYYLALKFEEIDRDIER